MLEVPIVHSVEERVDGLSNAAFELILSNGGFKHWKIEHSESMRPKNEGERLSFEELADNGFVWIHIPESGGTSYKATREGNKVHNALNKITVTEGR